MKQNGIYNYRTWSKKVIKRRIYIYLFKKKLANGITSWKCELRRKDGCCSSIKLDELDNFVEQVNDHRYRPSTTTCEIVRADLSIFQLPCAFWVRSIFFFFLMSRV